MAFKALAFNKPESEWQSVTATEDYDDSGTLVVEYQEDVAAVGSISEAVDAPPVTLDLLPLTQETAVPGTIKFDALGDTFIDRRGELYRDVGSDGAGILAGTINYETGEAVINDYPGSSQLSIRTLLSRQGDWTVQSVMFRTPGSPLKPGSLFVQATTAAGGLVDAQSNFDGDVEGTLIRGKVDYTTGVVRIAFGEFVDDSSLTTEEKNQPWYDSDNVKDDGTIWRPTEVLPTTIAFNVVVLQNLPLDADLLGLDPVRLPSDGRVPIYQRAGVTVLHNTQTDTMPDPLSAGETVALSRSPLALVWLEDQNGERVDRAQYSVDLEAGEVIMADPLDLSAYTQPLIAHHRIEDMLLVSDVEIDGRVTVTGGANRDYPADGNTWLSSALIHGDLQSRPTNFFEQASWDGSTWKDSVEGDSPTASYDDVNFPVEVDNQSAVKERWAIHFQDSSTFDVIGETIGVVATGDINTDVAPENPNTGQPYFVLRQDGFGSGWEAGNLIRFNTEAAAAPIWLIRTILSGDATEANDSFRIQNRGDAD